MNLITHLLLLLAGARLFGRLFSSIGFSPIIGEVLAGLILGPTILNVVTLSEQLNGILELSIFLLIFAAGLEVDLQDIFSAIRKKAFFCAIIGFPFSFASGLYLGYLTNLSVFSSLIMGLCFSVTALPVVIRFMRNNKIIDTKQGHTIMGASVLLDVTALLFLGVILSIETIDSPLQLSKILSLKMGGMIAFFLIVMGVNKLLRSEVFNLPPAKNIIKKLMKRMGDDVIFGIGVVFVLLFSTATEALGFHFIIGAFFGGLLLNKDIVGTGAFNSMETTLQSITSHFLTPIFFASIGLHFSVEAFNQPLLLFLIIIASYGSKILGSSLGAKWAGFDLRESTQIGIALNCKGTLDLIVAEIALAKGYIDSKIFSMLIFVGLLSLIINPMLFKRTLPKKIK